MRSFTLSDPLFLAAKAGVASGLALAGVTLLGIDDRVTAAFVAVLCCSPAVSIGLRQGLSQLAGSLVGGTVGTLALAVGLPSLLGVPLAVGLTIGATFLLRLHNAVAVAAFTALFVQIVPFGSPAMTWATRQGAVLVACAAGAIVNIVVSASFYPRIFRKRLRRVDAWLQELLADAARHRDPLRMLPAFRVLEELASELRSADHELQLRRADDTAAVLAGFREQVAQRQLVVHYLVGLGHAVAHTDVDGAVAAAWLQWVREPEQTPPPPAPETLGTLPERLVAAVRGVEPAA